MTPGATGTKRKRPDRTYSQDGSGADQPAAKSPRGSRFPSNAQVNSHSQGRNRDSGGRGGRDNTRGGFRSAQSPTSATFRSASGSGPIQANSPTPQASAAASQNLPTHSAAKQQPMENGSVLQAIPQIPSFRHYATMTEEVVKSWQDHGKTMVLEQALSAKQSQDHIKLGCLFQEIIFSGLDGRMALTEAGKTIKQIINSSSADGAQDSFDQEIAEAFLDTVAISCSNDTKNLRLRQILLATEIPSDTIVMILGDDMLEAQKLVRPNWTRMTIKHQTNALYRQANYNLLREETEGYSKLVTELFTTVENESSSDEVARVSFERVKAMIGSFNLDVGRVLDVTLDVFAAILVRHSAFLVKFLQLSTWWPREVLSEARRPTDSVQAKKASEAHSSSNTQNSTTDLQYERDEIFWARVKEVGLKAFFELGTGRAEASDLDTILPSLPDDVENNKNKDGTVTTKVTTPKTNILRRWVEETGTLPPQGNEDAAQILGFKLRFYNSAARDPDDNLPSNLIYLSALLIKIGFISLLDLYPHLWPSDEEMKAVESKLSTEKQEREKDRKPGGKNALELAGALVDDTLPAIPRRLEPATKPTAKPTGTPDPSTSQDKAVAEVKQLPDPVEQKIQLLRSLLCIGAIPEALFMLGQFPWLIDLVPELPEHINRIVHQSLSLVYDQIRPLQGYHGIHEPEKYADPEQVAAQKGYVQLATVAPRKTLRWAQIDKADGSDGVDYKFYWEDWTNNVPLCHSVDDVFLLCNTFLNLSGFKIGQDPLLMAKLSRIGIHSLETDTSEENKTRWMALCKRLLVPALSLSSRNSSTVAEVWKLLKRFPATTRYNIYFEWYLGQTSRNKDIQSAFNYSQAETKDVLKKISKTNTRPMARLLAKVAVASPGKVFEVIIKQIESYDNLIGVVVEASRFFTELGYDVLVWSLINALGKARSRVQKDGLLTSQWLSKLAGFCGTVFKKYPVMNPIPVLQYVTNQLLNHNSTDLVVLEHLIKQMAGITQDASFDNSKIIAMCGGPVLRAKTMSSLDDERSDPTKQNSTKRLMKALVTSNLTGALLIAISQERQSCIFNVDEADAYLKLLGNFFDEIHRVLTQYVDLIHTNLDDKEFRTLVPTLAELVGQYGIEPAIAFWIWRPIIVADIAVYDRNLLEKATSAETVTVPDSLKDIEMTDSEKPSTESEIEKNEPAKTVDPDVTMAGDSIDVTESNEARSGHPVVQELIESVRPVLPDTTFEMISDLFYFTFWRLGPYDLHIPETYQEESKRLTAKIEQLKKERGGTSVDVRNREIQRKQLTEQNTKIAAELKDHLTAYQRTKVALSKEKDKWFDLSARKWQDLNLAILEHCFIPRMVLSSVDSYFVFKMLKVLHSMGAKNFRTMGLLDCFFEGKRLLPLIFSCTQKEAENVARFVSEILKDLKKWHATKDLYEKEAFGAKRDLPGFKKNLRDADSFMDYESFRTLLAKWHRNLYDAIRECLKSPEYMHIKNAILISKEVVESFPAIDWMGRNIEEAVKHVNVNDDRGDLKMLSLALLGMLKSKSGKWVTAPVFARHKQGQVNGPPVGKASSTSVKSPAHAKSLADVSQPNNTLNAKAPEFVPSAISIDPTKKRDARGEAEDGEIRTPVTAKLTAATPDPPHNTQQGSEQAEASSGADNRPQNPPLVSRTVNGNASDKSVDKINDRTNTQLPPRPAADFRRTDAPSRPDLISRTQAHHSRQPEPPRSHVLPSRSDFNDPQRSANFRPSEWMPDRGPSRINNDSRDNDYRRSDRPGDPSRLNDTDYRSANRPYDRPHPADRESQSANWNGDRNNASRSHDERGSTLHPRAPIIDEKSDRPQRDAPPPLDSRDRYREPESHDSRSRDNSRGSRLAEPIHSDRTLLLKTAQEQDRNQHSGHTDRRHEIDRSEYHGPSLSRLSRGSSPVRRGEDGVSRSDYKRYDDRQTVDTRRSTEQASTRSRNDDSRQPYPSRSSHHGDNMQNSYGDRGRDEPRNSHSARQDQNNNWHKQESRPPPRQQDSSYGRLTQDPPAGPRTNNNNNPSTTSAAPRQTRSNSLQQATSESRNSGPPAALPMPGGPAGGREPKRAASNYVKPPPITTTVTKSTPIPPSPDTAGIHPDRLKALQGASNSEPLNNSEPSRPVPAQAPAGPRNAMPEALDSPSAFEGGRGRSDKRFAQLNNVLSQTNGSPVPERSTQVPVTRGRGEQINDGMSSAYSSSKNPPTPTNTGPRQEQFPSRGPPTNSSRNSDEASGRRSLRSDDHQMSRPQDGYSHNDNSRSKSNYNTSRESNMRPPSADMRDSRARGSAPFPQTPPLHNHQDRERRPTRDSMQGSSDRSNGRRESANEDWGREPQQRSSQPRRDHPQSDGGSGRKRGRGNEEMYEHGPAAYDHSKRPRRG